MINPVPVPSQKRDDRRNLVRDPDWRKLLGWGWEVIAETDDDVRFFHPDRPNVTCYFRKARVSYVVGTDSPIGFSTPEKAHNAAVRCYKSGV